MRKLMRKKNAIGSADIIRSRAESELGLPFAFIFFSNMQSMDKFMLSDDFAVVLDKSSPLITVQRFQQFPQV
jgi:hypothetical protein